MNLKRALNNRVVSNAGWLMAGKMIQMAINLAISMLTARFLGPSNYGLISYAGAYTAFFSSLCELGIHSVVVKDIVAREKNDGLIMGTSVGMRLTAGILSTVTIVGVSLIADAGEPLTQQVVLLCATSLIFKSLDAFEFWFQAKLRSKVTAIVTLAAHIITSIYKIVLLVRRMPVIYFAAVSSIDYFCIGMMLYLCYKKQCGERLLFSGSYGKQVLKKGYHYVLSGMMISIYGQTDKIMLKHMISEAELGYYSTAASLCNCWCFVLSAIISSMYPVIIEAFKNSKEDFDRKNKMLYAIVFYTSACVSLMLTLFGRFAISLLYGEAYIPAANPLRIITWYTAFSYLGVARDVWIVCMEKQKYLKYIYLSAAVVNVILNMAFIPLWGASGAAVASLAAQIATIVVPFFIKDMRENSVLMVKAILFR